MQLSPEDWDNREGRALIMRRAGGGTMDGVEVTALLMNARMRRIDFHAAGRLSTGSC